MILRNVNINDIDFLYEIRKEYTWDKLPTFEDHHKFVMAFLYDNENHPYKKWYIISYHGSGIGVIPIKKTNEFGYQIFKSFQGQGLIHKVFKILFKKHKNLWGKCDPKNTRSQKLLNRYGLNKNKADAHSSVMAKPGLN